jgi:hypothetical protein
MAYWKVATNLHEFLTSALIPIPAALLFCESGLFKGKM